MTLSDVVNVYGKYQLLRLISHDISGNPCSSKFYRSDELPNDFLTLNVIDLFSVPVRVIEVNLDILGDPFHEY